ncbi:MAG: DMT family transporter [Chloroflexi bacterium]|nr:DMT family transporter [Chloroflexota bacterium]MBI4506478.1 DMT family transporter [Chloroflexota bacterium]
MWHRHAPGGVAGLLRRAGLRGRAPEPRGYAAAFGATLLWGVSTPLVKVLLAQAGVLAIGSARSAVATLVLSVLLWLRHGRSGFVLSRDELLRLAFVTSAGWVVCQIAWLVALARISAAVTIILSNTSPMFVALMAALWLHEPLGRRALAGLVVSFAGILLVIGGGSEPSGPLDLLGVGAALLSAATWAGYTVGCRSLLKRHDPLRIAALSSIIASCWIVPLGFFEPPESRIRSLEVLLGTLYLGVVPHVIANMLFYFALRRLPAVQVGAFQYTVPLWAVVLSAVWLGEAITPPLIAGMLLVLAGVRLAQQR